MTQEINSGKPATVKRPILSPMTPQERESARLAGLDRRARRFAQAKENLPPRAFAIVANAPALYQDRLVKACLGVASPKVAIRAQCEQCVGWEEVKTRVGQCNVRACALWHFRPYQEK
jgi:hypothetical protein